MNIVAISDTHGKHREITKFLPKSGDVLVHSGDFSADGSMIADIEDFLQWMNDLPYEHKIFIAGNHDFYPFEDYDGFMNLLEPYESLVYLQDQSIVIDDLKFYGSPWVPYMGNRWAFELDEDASLNEICWGYIPTDADVVLTHTPPYGIYDKVKYPYPGEDPNVGCTHLLYRLAEVKPLLHSFGHIHEGGNTIPMISGKTTFINASVLNHNYMPFSSQVNEIYISR